jgi:hypothetical protein
LRELLAWQIVDSRSLISDNHEIERYTLDQRWWKSGLCSPNIAIDHASFGFGFWFSLALATIWLAY